MNECCMYERVNGFFNQNVIRNVNVEFKFVLPPPIQSSLGPSAADRLGRDR